MNELRSFAAPQARMYEFLEQQDETTLRAIPAGAASAPRDDVRGYSRDPLQVALSLSTLTSVDDRRDYLTAARLPKERAENGQPDRRGPRQPSAGRSHGVRSRRPCTRSPAPASPTRSTPTWRSFSDVAQRHGEMATPFFQVGELSWKPHRPSFISWLAEIRFIRDKVMRFHPGPISADAVDELWKFSLLHRYRDPA